MGPVITLISNAVYSCLKASWFRRLTGLVALSVLQSGCEFDVAERLSQHPEVAGVALLTEESTDLMRLTMRPWGEDTVRVEFLDARGRPIPSLGQDHRSLIEWVPAGSATSVRVPGESFLHTVTIADPCRPPVAALVGYGHDARSD